MALLHIKITDNGKHWEKEVRILGIKVYHRHDYTSQPAVRKIGFTSYQDVPVEIEDEDYYEDMN